MKWTIQFEHPAQIELAEAFDHYNRLSFGLGGDFLRMVAAAEERLAHNPLAYPPTGLRFRRILLRRFPYSLHFEILEGQRVSVLACLHHKQSPRRWP